ncbi:hypothetical protein [Aquisphaera insulae]|uniref:hypothetical protein n=1 Tax=Aquisphaera insulae TaxID=2712864 RepID=UPI0013ECF11F|nr:hypothetical protein [Aquisphaera insulae]
MTRIHGQILRFVGILFEMLGIFLLFFLSKVGPDGVPLPGSISQRTAWGVIAGGFGIWALGNAVLYWPRPRATPSDEGKPRQDDGLGLRL